MNLISTISILLAAGMYGLICLYWAGKINSKSPFGFWGGESWVRKYKTKFNSPLEAPKNWYYRHLKVKYKEKFPLSATALVMFTDGFHLAQWFMIKFIILALTQNLITYFIYWGVWIVGFDIIYNKRIPDLIKRIRGGSHS